MWWHHLGLYQFPVNLPLTKPDLPLERRRLTGAQPSSRQPGTAAICSHDSVTHHTNKWINSRVCLALDTEQKHAALTGQWRHQNYHLTNRMQKKPHFLLTCFCFLLIYLLWIHTSFCCGNDYYSSSGSDKRMQDKASKINQIKNKIKTQTKS